jgi:hypothetical protein
MLTAATATPKTKAPAPGDRARPASGSTPAIAAANPIWDALAMGVQAKLQVGATDDPAEAEADRIADQVMRMPQPQVQRRCAACAADDDQRPVSVDEEQPVRRRTDGGEAATEVPDAFSDRLGEGEPMDAASRRFFEPRFGRDFGDVRVHADGRAAAAAASIRAQAFTLGRHVVFGAGRHDASAGGRRLLAHELTHVVQQRGGAPGPDTGPAGAGPLRRTVNGDIRSQSITADWARDLTDAELVAQHRVLDEQLAALAAGSPDEAAAQANRRVLDQERDRRTLASAGASDAAMGPQVVRPPGLPLDGGFELLPTEGLPDDLAAAIPEGRIVVFRPPATDTPGASPGASPGAADPALRGAQVLGGAYAGARLPINAALLDQGFAAAGDTAVGMVAIPRQLLNPLSPNFRMIDPAAPLDVWGHTAMYVRRGGRITVVRGFNPQMNTVSSFLDVARGGDDIVAGARGVTADISADAYLFRATASRSIEWPVSAATAEQLVSGLPGTGPVAPGSGQPGLYTADPAAFAAAHPELGPVGCTGSNCGLWAAQQIEPSIGGPIGRPGQPPIMDLGPGGSTVPGAARQGRLIGMLDDVAAGADALPAGAVIGRMPTYLRYLKWGGRVFLVVGIASIPLEIALARPEDRARTAVGATAGFAGGLAFGAAAGLVCGPGALVCSVVLGLGFGIVGAWGTRAVAEGLYDDAHPRTTAITDPEAMRQTIAMANAASPCPNCHASPPSASDPFRIPGGVFGGPAMGTRPAALSPAEVQVIVDYLRASGDGGARSTH